MASLSASSAFCFSVAMTTACSEACSCLIVASAFCSLAIFVFSWIWVMTTSFQRS